MNEIKKLAEQYSTNDWSGDLPNMARAYLSLLDVAEKLAAIIEFQHSTEEEVAALQKFEALRDGK